MQIEVSSKEIARSVGEMRDMTRDLQRIALGDEKAKEPGLVGKVESVEHQVKRLCQNQRKVLFVYAIFVWVAAACYEPALQWLRRKLGF